MVERRGRELDIFCVVCMCSEVVSAKFYFCLTSKTFLSWCYLLIWEDSRGLCVNLNLCFIAAYHMALFFLESGSLVIVSHVHMRSFHSLPNVVYNKWKN